jgi:hypothetical protein
MKNTRVSQLILLVGDIQTFTGLNEKESERMMEVLSLTKRSEEESPCFSNDFDNS